MHVAPLDLSEGTKDGSGVSEELSCGLIDSLPHCHTDELDVFGPPLTARRTRDDEEEEGIAGAGGSKKKRAKTTKAGGGGGGEEKPKAPSAVSSTVYEGGECLERRV